MSVCAYCRKARAVNRDHVVPQALAKKLKKSRGLTKKRALVEGAPTWLFSTVPSCFSCNMFKSTRRLIPEAWEDRIPVLTEWFPGTPWRVWHGSKDEPAFREVHP